VNLARSVLVGASFGYLGNAVPAVWLSLRDDLAAEPFGIRTGLDARGDLSRGIGSALCAPLPMLVALGMHATRAAGSAQDDRATVGALTGLGAAFLCGMLAEPVAREVVERPGAHPARTAVVVANVVLPAVMVVAGLACLTRRRNDFGTLLEDDGGDVGRRAP
jgi:hypothetical protein